MIVMNLKNFIIAISGLCIGVNVSAQTIPKQTPDTSKKVDIAEFSCGECQFKMSGKSCDLAVRINGKVYFVEGTTIDEHGDAHANDGFCNSIRKAEVQGEIVGNKYIVSYLRLLPVK
jgi:hypothetical protein